MERIICRMNENGIKKPSTAVLLFLLPLSLQFQVLLSSSSRTGSFLRTSLNLEVTVTVVRFLPFHKVKVPSVLAIPPSQGKLTKGHDLRLPPHLPSPSAIQTQPLHPYITHHPSPSQSDTKIMVHH